MDVVFALEIVPLRSSIFQRGLVFLLASLSFACLLGQFYGLWTMHWFGCWVLPPAALILAWLAWRDRIEARSVSQGPAQTGGPRVWIVRGAIGGIIAAIAYDLYRLPFVLGGAPLYKPFAEFGRLLLGGDGPPWLVQAIGWAYHFSNGAALGIMFLAMVIRPTPRRLFWGAVAWAMVAEAILLCTPYTGFFGLTLDAKFLFLTATAHAVFGIVLGLWCRWRLQVHAADAAI